MNIENIDKAIAVMTRAGTVNMDNWQEGGTNYLEETLHTCKTAACFAGWIGASPEWQEAGGIIRNGQPLFEIGEEGSILAEDSLSKWLGLHTQLVQMLIYEFTAKGYSDCGELVYTIYDNILYEKLQASDIVNTLTQIRDLGQIGFLEKQIKNLQEIKDAIRISKEYEENTDITDINCELLEFTFKKLITEIGSKMNKSKTYEVVYFSDHGGVEVSEALHELLELNETFSKEIKKLGINKFIRDIPRHHPELVNCIKQLLMYRSHSGWGIETINSPMYTITEYDGKETVISLEDLDCNASEFN